MSDQSDLALHLAELHEPPSDSPEWNEKEPRSLSSVRCVLKLATLLVNEATTARSVW